MKPGVEALRALPLLAACAAETLAKLNETADLARVGPDDRLSAEDEVLTEVNFLAVGQVAALRTLPSGRQAVVDVHLPVRPLLLATALLGRPAPVAMQAITAARLIVVPLDALQAAMQADAATGRVLLDHITSEADALGREICGLKLRSSAQRLALFLLDLADDAEVGPARFVLPFEKRLLAARVGCSQENLSRAFATLRRIGVESQRGVVIIRSLPQLRAFVDGALTPMAT